MYVCMYVYIHIYIYTHAYAYITCRCERDRQYYLSCLLNCVWVAREWFGGLWGFGVEVQGFQRVELRVLGLGV